MIVGIFCENYTSDNEKSKAAHRFVLTLKEQGHNVMVITTGKTLEITPHLITVPYNRFDGFPLFARFRYIKTYHKLRKIPFDVVHVFSTHDVSALGIAISHYQLAPLVYSYFPFDYYKKQPNDFTRFIAYRELNLSLFAFQNEKAVITVENDEEVAFLRDAGYRESLTTLEDCKEIVNVYRKAQRRRF